MSISRKRRGTFREELCLFWQKILSCFIQRPCISQAGLVTIQTGQEANIVNKDARLRDGARPMAAECGQTANQRSLPGPDTAVMAAIKFEFVLIPAISPGSDYHLCIRSQHKSLAGPVKTRPSEKYKHQGSWCWCHDDIAESRIMLRLLWYLLWQHKWPLIWWKSVLI